LLDDEIVKYSRRFGLTIYEIANMQRDFITELKKSVLREVFKKIDDILKKEKEAKEGRDDEQRL